MMSEQSAPRLRGLWHIALRVQNMARSRTFYQEVLGMKVVWEPDPDNIYLSLGQDNLALHQLPQGQSLIQHDQPSPSAAVSPLDHFGIIVDRKEDVDLMAKRMEQASIPLVKPVRLHRDGSYSFYIEDPDRNVIQILYLPYISKPI
jgi:catechol 2,3-dioxygenase-like lactoylglutathione lyase family enzyme